MTSKRLQHLGGTTSRRSLHRRKHVSYFRVYPEANGGEILDDDRESQTCKKGNAPLKT